MAKETIFYQEDDVLVTNTRFVIGTEVFAMRSVASVEGARVRPNVAVPGAMVIFGALLFVMLFADDEKIWAAIAGIMAVTGIILAIFKKRPFAVVLRTASGEAIAYESNDRDDISKIIAALNEAIIAQGESTNQGDAV